MCNAASTMIGIAPDMARSRWVLLVSANPVVINIPRREEKLETTTHAGGICPSVDIPYCAFFQCFKLPVDTVGLIVMLWEK